MIMQIGIEGRIEGLGSLDDLAGWTWGDLSERASGSVDGFCYIFLLYEYEGNFHVEVF